MTTTGVKAYEDKFIRLSKQRIEKSNPEWLLNGFYYSMIIKNSYKTAYLYLSYVSNFMENRSVAPSDLDVDDYFEFMAGLKNMSYSEQNGMYHALKKYSRYLKAKNICEDYMKYIERPKYVESQETINKREVGFLTKTEAKKMINSAQLDPKKSNTIKARNYAIMMIFLTTGIRCSALYKLDVDNIDLERKTLTTHEKGNKYRVVNIPDLTVEAIKIWLEYRKEYLGDKYHTEDALIVSTHKRRMESESIYVLIKRIGKIITGKNITPHKLRATYGTQLYNKTRDLFFVQTCMGHANPKTTEIYIRGQKNEFSLKAANLMEGFIE